MYSEEISLKRNAVLQKDIKELQSGIEELEEICHNKSEYEQAREIFLPTTAHILDYYDRMTSGGKPLVEIADGEDYILPKSRKAGQYRNSLRKVCKSIMKEFFAL